MASATSRKQVESRHQAPKSQSSTSDLSTYQKLFLYLTKAHPEYTASEFKDALYTFRQERQTLAGLTLDRIEEGLLDIVRQKYPDAKIDIDSTPAEASNMNVDDQSVAAALWSTFKRYREREKSSINNKNATDGPIHSEDQCLICLEGLSTKKTETFPCEHTFHRICLEEWFKVERTCPLCRKMLLFSDEFPSLK